MAYPFLAVAKWTRSPRQRGLLHPPTLNASSQRLLCTKRFSRRADMYATTEAQFTASGTADILGDRYIPLLGYLVTLRFNNGLQVRSKRFSTLYDRLGMNKIAVSSYHPCTNGDVKRVNHTMARMLAMVGDEQQPDWDIQLPHVESACNNSVSGATGLAPNEVHMGNLPRLPSIVFDLPNIGGYQSLNRDQLAYIDLAIARQQRAYRAVRQLHAIYVSRLDHRNPPLMDALRLLLPFSVNGWAWIYNFAATIRQGAKKGTGAIVLKTKLSFNWISPFKILAMGPGPASAVPDGRPLHDKLLYLDLPSDMFGWDCKPRVSVLRCRPCRNLDDIHYISKHLSADLTKYVLNSFSTKSPPFHATLDDISPPPERLEVDQTPGHQLVRRRGGVLAVMYETHWSGLISPS